ncbi:MAG: nicotinate-nucleotide adenylyltransferase [Clostridia bacterium]|nr:nicotinate-nucleotide adenylyltransferase [Clostridia bacterium]
MSRIGIMGGTFNPPHNGHVHAARQAAQTLQFDKLLLIPDNVPPHKAMPQGSASSEQRLEMTRRMAKLVPGAEASDMELRRGGRSYTADTLRRLTADNPGSTLYFIMGTDMLLTLDKWREPETICALASLAVIARDEADRDAIAQKAVWLEKTWQAHVEIVDCPALPVSSTEVRADRERCRDMVPEEIFAYIEQQGLYF